MKITDSILYIGVNDHETDLFEGQYKIENGISYNSYIIVDEKIAVFDTVDANFTHQWLDNIENALNGRAPDYLIIQHMEPDHSASISAFMNLYKSAVIVSSDKAFTMINQFFATDYADRRIVVSEGDSLSLGGHKLSFIAAPMVHWPEVIMTYESSEKVLFSADAFGKFGALDIEEDWACEARKYYIGIVGKYGQQVQSVLKKAAALDIGTICPLHGPVLSENLAYYLDLYNTWSSYGVETDGVVIAYTSVYGNTKKAVEKLAELLRTGGCPKVVLNDLARCDMAEAVEDAFRYGKLVLATTTYNADIFPFMREFINHLTERNFQNRKVAIIENGSWAPVAAKVIKGMLEKSKNIEFVEPIVQIRSALDADSSVSVEKLANALCEDYSAVKNAENGTDSLNALFNIGYGLYVVTSKDGSKDNGLILNTISQVTNSPNRVAVTINKENYSHHIIKKTGVMNINCLSESAPFSIFETFGFQSGRGVDKFASVEFARSENGLAILKQYINSFMSLKVISYVDLGTHGMFICDITESKIVSDVPTMTYTYYHKNVKPKPDTKNKKGFVCKICGYVYEGDVLPADFICPLCKHGASDFEPIG